MKVKSIEISSNSPEIGKVEEQIEADRSEGEELKISFSAKYMMDALKAIDGQDVNNSIYRCNATIYFKISS